MWKCTFRPIKRQPNLKKDSQVTKHVTLQTNDHCKQHKHMASKKAMEWKNKLIKKVWTFATFQWKGYLLDLVFLSVKAQ